MVAPNVRQHKAEIIENAAERIKRRSHVPTKAPPVVSHLSQDYVDKGGLENSFRQHIAILTRRRGMIATIVLSGTLLVALAAWWISPNYTALAQIDVGLPPQTNDAAWGTPRANQVIVDTHLVMLKSRDFLREVFVKSREAPDADPLADAGRDLDLQVEEFAKQVSVSQSLSSSVISIRYTSKSAHDAADVANQIVTLYRVRLRKRVAESLHAELDRLTNRIAEIDRLGSAIRVRRHDDSSRNPGPAGADSEDRLGELEQAARTNTRLLADLHRRQMDTRRRLEAIHSDVAIVSHASVPVAPSSLHPMLLIVPGVVLLFIASCFWAIFIEQLDEGMRSTGDITAALSIPCVGLLPRVHHFGFAGPHKYLERQPFTPYAEAIRSIAAALNLVAPSRSSEVIALSSSEPGEGKTTLAVSIAQYAASIGRRVLLVDLDVRTPGVLRELKLHADRSVVDLVRDDIAPEVLVQRHPALAFDYLPMQPDAIDPLSLIASEKLHAAFGAFRTNYELVVVDGPSALGPSDAGLLAALADRVLFVVKWAATRKGVAQNAVRVLRMHNPGGPAPADLISAVVSQVPLKAHAQYRFGDAVEVITKHGYRLLPRSHRRSPSRAFLASLQRGGTWLIAVAAARIATRFGRS
jgi:polysaccharide biosynthesis transport protein